MPLSLDALGWDPTWDAVRATFAFPDCAPARAPYPLLRPVAALEASLFRLYSDMSGMRLAAVSLIGK